MKQAQNARKQRGRPAPRKGGRSNSSGGAGNRSENKVRGNPKQLLEKYKTQARDALQAGDRVTSEYYFQFADHYQRVVNDMQQNSRDQGRDQGRDEGEKRGRKDHGRRDRQAKPADENQVADGEDVAVEAANAPEEQEAVAANPAESEQPVEVHPELGLDGTVAPEKPKRRAPVRRRRMVKPKAEAEEAAPVEAESKPEGGEAA